MTQLIAGRIYALIF